MCWSVDESLRYQVPKEYIMVSPWIASKQSTGINLYLSFRITNYFHRYKGGFQQYPISMFLCLKILRFPAIVYNNVSVSTYDKEDYWNNFIQYGMDL